VSNIDRAAVTDVPTSAASCSAAERNPFRFQAPDSSTRGANNIAIDSANRAARTAADHIVDTSHNATASGSNSAANSRNANSRNANSRNANSNLTQMTPMRRTHTTTLRDG
jgi:hypothetical protein